MTSSTLICFMTKASPTQAWLWHRILSHRNFDYINFLSKKDIVIGLPKLKYVKDQLCSSCEVSKAKKTLIQDKEQINSTKSHAEEKPDDHAEVLPILSVHRYKKLLSLPHAILLDVKTTFLNGSLKEEVYVAQLDRFVDPDHLDTFFQMPIMRLLDIAKALQEVEYSILAKDEYVALSASCAQVNVGCGQASRLWLHTYNKIYTLYCDSQSPQ
ncbi:retrovirus-related pol polyprotein from transposon TNT 1-94 [Tanacetum coccineum]